MKIIEALKAIKANKKKVQDLVSKIAANSAILSHQSSPYGDAKAAKKQIDEWLDSVRQTLRDTEVLSRRIHKTNNETLVTIELGGTQITKSIDEWLTRRKDGVELHTMAYRALNDRNLREDFIQQPDGSRVPVTIVRHFDPVKRDEALSILGEEVYLIDSRLEITNAVTDLLE